jgi:hypothetical protein
MPMGSSVLGPDAPSKLETTYHTVNVIFLVLGFFVWLQVFQQWRVCIRHTTAVIRSYAYLSLADFITIAIYLPLSIQGLVSGIPGALFRNTTHCLHQAGLYACIARLGGHIARV